MSLCVKLEPLNKQVLERSTATLGGSVAYIQEIIRIAAVNIVFNRVDYPEEVYRQFKLGDTFYKVVSAKIDRSHDLCRLYYVLKSAGSAIAQKYIEDLHVLIVRRSNNTVLEQYKFHIGYLDDNSERSHASTHQEMIQQSAEFFKAIHQLKQMKTLNSKELLFAVKLTTNKDAPEDFMPKLFTRNSNIRNLASEYYLLGHLDTGYHSLELGMYQEDNDTPPTAEAPVTDLARCSGDSNKKQTNQNNSKEIVDILSISSCDGSSEDDEPICINCGCGVMEEIKHIDLIECDNCHTYQHIQCIGFLFGQSVPKPYHCIRCLRDYDLPVPVKRRYDVSLSQKKLMVISFLRLFAYISYQTNKVPTFLYNFISKSMKKPFLKMITIVRIIKDDESNTPDLRVIHEEIMPKYFNEQNLECSRPNLSLPDCNSFE